MKYILKKHNFKAFRGVPSRPILIAALEIAEEAGLSLAEVLMAMIVFGLALYTSTQVFGGAIQRIFGSGEQGNANAAINSDVAKIKSLAERYNACADPLGSTTDCWESNNAINVWPDGTTRIREGDSWYYFPAPQNSGAVTTFIAACEASDESDHITKRFIDSINEIPQDELQRAGVDRSDAVRDEPSDPSDHVIRVRYTNSSLGIDRVVKILPTVSAWCS